MDRIPRATAVVTMIAMVFHCSLPSFAATATVEGRLVIVTCPAVPEPVAVRYACRGAPQNPNLYNRAGLPASPFCSRLEFLPWAPPKAP